MSIAPCSNLGLIFHHKPLHRKIINLTHPWICVKGFISDFDKVAIEAVRSLCLGDLRNLVEHQLEIFLHPHNLVLPVLHNLK